MNNETLEKIKNFAKASHFSQLDKGGNDYFESHLVQVANNFKNNTLKAIAYLHDIIEDTNLKIEELEQILALKGVENKTINEIISSVKLLTKTKGMDYDKYIDSISYNKVALMIKVADMKNNCDLSRIPNVSEKDTMRTEKYLKTLDWIGWD